MNQFVVPVAEAWMDDAKCGRLPWDGLNTEVNVEVCGRCPVRDECSRYADRVEKNLGPSTLHDVYGGETPVERFHRRNPLHRSVLSSGSGVCPEHGAHIDFHVSRDGYLRCRPCRRVTQNRLRSRKRETGGAA